MYKIIAFDIDGTLLPFGQKGLSTEIHTMLKKLKENNYITAFVTGRDFITIGNMLHMPNIDYFLGANGAFIYDVNRQEVILEEVISHEDTVPLKEYCDREDFNYNIITHKAVYFKDKTKYKDNWFWLEFYERIQPIDHPNLLEEKIHQITLSAYTMEEKNKLVQYVSTLDNIEVNTIWERGLFIGPEGINKSVGLKRLCLYLNLDIKNVIAFGDSSNDFEMLRDAGLGIAMENASKEVKSIANDICDSVENLGVYKKLSELKIIE